MKINKIQFYTNKPINNNYKYNIANTETYVSNPIKFAYQDFSISFKAMPPEEFYETEHNVNYMPVTMKTYLHEDYETKRHLPPEQIMNQSFKYLEVADNIEDAKNIYPNEPLFANLHEASLKGRSGILSDIKLAQEMSETPLFTDGSNHLGIYLLKKIFLEGKTMKEINKDFYEKDLAPEFRGIVTQPITYNITSAYGIRYPKTDFWNSFISTRDDYRKLYPRLPRQSKSELKKELERGVNEGVGRSDLQAGKNGEKGVNEGVNKGVDGSKLQTKEVNENKPAPRKFTIKKYQKDQIKQEIEKSKGDKKAITDSIRKRFSKDDPEAAFIVKYLSPIMTIAADKIHLSEEERYFAETKNSKGEKIENLFSRFWKANPHLLKQYSTAITDTIELFEENYAYGGMIPINNEFQIITESTENKKAIDYVTKEFLELLDFAQTIVPTRLQRTEKHDTLQKEWDEHFLWRYGELKEEVIEPKTEKINPEQLLEKTAAANNAKVYHLTGINDEDIIITANLDETFGDYMRSTFFGYPSKFINLLINKGLKHPLMNENAKLSFSCIPFEDKINDANLLNEAERIYILNLIKSESELEMHAAAMAIMDVFALKSGSPVKIYRNIYQDQREEDVAEYNTLVQIYGNDSEVKADLNRLYDLYKKPMTTSELTKISIALLDFIRNFDKNSAQLTDSVFYQKSGLTSNIRQTQEMLKDKSSSTRVKEAVKKALSNLFYAKTLLQNQSAKVQYKAKLEVITSAVMNSLIQSAKFH